MRRGRRREGPGEDKGKGGEEGDMRGEGKGREEGVWRERRSRRSNLYGMKLEGRSRIRGRKRRVGEKAGRNQEVKKGIGAVGEEEGA